MDNSDSYRLPIIVIAILCLVVSIVIWIKIRKTCGDVVVQKYTRVKASPPSPGEPASWVDGSVEDCQSAFDSVGCDEKTDCCGCGPQDEGPLYYCDGTFMSSHNLGADPSCPIGTPVALNKKMCKSPVKAGPMYCGGELENDCQDFGQTCKPQPQLDLPFGALGICG